MKIPCKSHGEFLPFARVKSELFFKSFSTLTDKWKIPCKRLREFLSFSRVKFESFFDVEILHFEPLYRNENSAKFFSTMTNEKSILNITVNFFIFHG